MSRRVDASTGVVSAGDLAYLAGHNVGVSGLTVAEPKPDEPEVREDGEEEATPVQADADPEPDPAAHEAPERKPRAKR